MKGQQMAFLLPQVVRSAGARPENP